MKKIIIIALSVIVGIFVLCVVYDMGAQTATTTLNGKIADANDIGKEINSRIKEKRQLIKDNKQLFDTVHNQAKIEDEYNQDLKDLDKIKSDIDSATSDLDSINSKIDDKKKELQKLTSDVVVAKGKPKTLQAGTYTAGKDFPAGRYKATPVGQGSNLFTYDELGNTDVNTILGSDGEPSYTFEIEDNYTLQTESTVTLTPIE